MRLPPLTPRRLAFLVAAGVVVFDQLTKAWVMAALADGPVDLIDGVFRLALVRNPGAAFGVLQGAGSIIALLAVAAAVLIFVALRGIGRSVEGVALGLILGGAVGNLIDRIFRGDGLLDGKVVDFLDFSFFPAFNVADSAITVGAAVILWEALRESRRSSSPTP